MMSTRMACSNLGCQTRRAAPRRIGLRHEKRSSERSGEGSSGGGRRLPAGSSEAAVLSPSDSSGLPSTRYSPKSNVMARGVELIGGAAGRSRE